jgi:hypothetical protein
MTSELFTIHATTCSDVTYSMQSSAIANFSGAMYLKSSLWSGLLANTAGTVAVATNFVQIPKGCALKIWEKKAYGQVNATIVTQVSVDSGATYTDIGAIGNGTSGSQTMTMDRPTRPDVIEAHNSMTRVRFNGLAMVNATTGQFHGDFLCEIVELNYD